MAEADISPKAADCNTLAYVFSDGYLGFGLRRSLISGIYCIECIPTGQSYIGSSVDIFRRWSHHLTLLRKFRHHCRALQNAWFEYGQENFEFSIVEVVCDPSCLSKIEQRYVIECDNLFNSLVVVDTSGVRSWTQANPHLTHRIIAA